MVCCTCVVSEHNEFHRCLNAIALFTLESTRLQLRTAHDDVKTIIIVMPMSYIVVICSSNLSMDYVTDLKYHLCQRRAATETTPPLDVVYSRKYMVILFVACKQYDVLFFYDFVFIITTVSSR